MVRKLGRIGLICLLAAGIASCKFLSGTLDFLTTSYYPFYLSRVLERYDVADLIPELKGLSSEDVSVSFAYLPSSSGKHLLMKVVFKTAVNGKTPEGRLLVFDESLRLERSYLRSELSSYKFGNLMMSDANGDLIVGFYDSTVPSDTMAVIDGDTGESVFSDFMQDVAQYNGFSYAGSRNFILSGTDGSNLTVMWIDNLWTTPTSTPFIISSTGTYYLMSVNFDDSRADGKEVACLFRNSYGGCTAVFLPISEVFSLSLTTPILESSYSTIAVGYGYSEDQYAFITSDGLVTRSSDYNKLVLTDFYGNTDESPSFEDSSQIEGMYFEPSGKYVFAYNFETGELYKSYTWWRP